MQHVAIISKPQKPELATLLPELIYFLKERGFEAHLDETSAAYVKEHGMARNTMAGCCPSLVIVLGGDGTLLSAARAFAKTDTPILSANLGSLGFLTEVPLSEIYKTFDAWQEGSCSVDQRSMMHAELWRDDEVYQAWDALNDVVISKGAIARMGDYSIQIGGQSVARFRADGVIVSTPTGSTAYSLAADGPIVMGSVEAMVVTPICPHLLTLRPIVTPADTEIRISVVGIADQTFLTVDGQEAVELKVADEVHCRRSQYSVRLVRLGEHGLFNVLRSKLKWGER
ncbi:NAD(+)/NADH kinase [Terriglobus sp. RCC_193]|uniref:NAD(+)/NADH kinase n=1 Tax=Terriglobus sp. RCC_193 TaxID=3239218 RepID=UPI0035244034